MRLHKQLWIRRIRYTWKKMRRRKLRAAVIAVLCVLIISCIHLWVGGGSPAASPPCVQMDVVYTWVNGSDPELIREILKYDASYDPARFDDKNELRYSLRSLELYAPWVRHVYIVTNGQIPHWLDLSNERVTVVPHSLLTPYPEFLPTFSSPAIETFLHRIPKLSKRFLYMNDDIFLGAPLHPEDLYTEADGVRIYQAWLVPDCSEDCPWTYIGDGACDRHCNIAQCQYDGGDCVNGDNAKSGEVDGMERDVEEQQPTKATKQPPKKLNNTNRLEIRHFPKRKIFRGRYVGDRNASSFKEIVRQKNLTTLNELREIVDSYNSNKTRGANANPHRTSTTTYPPLMLHTVGQKSVKDVFSQSLIQTNRLLNRLYGFRPRNVLAHVGFLLDRDIVTAMQTKFATEIYETSKNRFRAPDDLQFAFAYYSFLMSETRTASIQEIFSEFDTDGSQTWSDREIRTFLARTFPLPLDWSAVRFFEEVVGNCSRDLGFDRRADSVVYSTLVYERYEDSNVPTITQELVAKCQLLAEALESNFGIRPKYKFNNSKRAGHSNFMMLTSNVTDVVDGLDKIRRNPRKFNCINDNLELANGEENELIRHLLEDFYLSFFPRRSSFELQSEYRNRYTNWHDYQRWRRRKRAALVLGYGVSGVLIAFLFKFVCMHKAKFVRRYVQRI